MSKSQKKFLLSFIIYKKKALILLEARIFRAEDVKRIKEQKKMVPSRNEEKCNITGV